MANRPPPHNADVEANYIGSMLLRSEYAYEGVRYLEAGDFYLPKFARVFGAIKMICDRGQAVEVVSVAAEAGLGPEENLDLTSLMMNSTGSGNFEAWAAIIRRHSSARRLLVELSGKVNAIMDGSDPYEIGADLERFIPSLGAADHDAPVLYTIRELADMPESMAPTVIPGMMDQDFRTLVVAEEGVGKSVVLRTIAQNAAQGFHPFSHARIPPVRTLYIDLENPRKAILQLADPFDLWLAERAGSEYDGSRFKVLRAPGGIEIRRLADRSKIERAIASHRPQLVCIGPIYKMYHKGNNETYEDSAEGAMQVLDHLRTHYEFALLLEHHAPKAQGGKKRELTPMGSQRWMAWPEIGISLYKNDHDPTNIDVRRFRGDRLNGVDWPNKILRHPRWLMDGVWDKLREEI